MPARTRRAAPAGMAGCGTVTGVKLLDGKLAMNLRHCLCGAEPDLKHREQISADGRTENLFWVACPVCGALGPKMSDLDSDTETAKAAAVAAWNAMVARTRPSEA